MFLLSCVFRKCEQWFKNACYATVSVNTSNPNLPCFVILVVQHPYLSVVAGWSACIHRFWRFVFPSYLKLGPRPHGISWLCAAYWVKLCPLSSGDYLKLSSLSRFSQPFASFHQYRYFLLLHNLGERRREKRLGFHHPLCNYWNMLYDWVLNVEACSLNVSNYCLQIWREKSNHHYEFGSGSTISSLILAFVVQLRLRSCVNVKHK